jgi:hypothetical protein
MSADRASRPDLKFGCEAIPMYNSPLSYAEFSYAGNLKSVSILTRYTKSGRMMPQLLLDI